MALSQAEYRTRLLRLIRRLEPTTSRAVLAAFDCLLRQANRRELEVAIEGQSAERVAIALRLDERLAGCLDTAGRPRTPVNDARSKMAWLALALAVAYMLGRLGIKPKRGLGLGERMVLEWLRARAPQLARDLSADARRAIAATLADSFAAGDPLGVTAAKIAARLSLSERGARAVGRYEAELRAAGVPERRVRSLAAEYARRLRQARARLIAQDELGRAMRTVERLLHEDLALRGLLRRDEWEREWTSVLSSHTCAFCFSAHGLRAPIGGIFPNGYAEAYGHMACMCSETLVLKAEPAPSQPPFVEPERGKPLRPMTPAEAAR